MSEHHEQFAASQPPMDMAMIQEAHAAQKSLVQLGREQAATWHDGQALECSNLHTLHTKAGRDLLANAAVAMMQFHINAAIAIRALTDQR